MQSSVLALMSCANKLIKEDRAGGFSFTYINQVPIYDAIVFYDLREE